MIKRGVAYTAIEIILKAASNADGKIATRDLIINVKGSKMVKDISLLSEHVRGKIGKDKYDPTVGVHIVEKTLSQLKTKGILESETISDGKFKFRGYRLKCSNLFDLAGIYLFILEGEKHWTKGPYSYPRMRRFLMSPFFARAIKEYIFDLIYYFDLWDMKKYPISKRCCEALLAEERKSIGIPYPTPILFYAPFTGPSFPNFYRENFPGEGPAKYESFLKSIGFDDVFLRDLGLLEYHDTGFSVDLDVVEQTAKLFMFVTRTLEIDPIIRRPREDRLTDWFIRIWYGGLEDFITSQKNAKLPRIALPWDELVGRVCLRSLGEIVKEGYSFLNPITFLDVCFENDVDIPEFIIRKYHFYDPYPIKLFLT
ncbi:MAG: hypothetical protein QXV17_11030 [Candidatus Micrarchaeaceae archaeon]